MKIVFGAFLLIVLFTISTGLPSAFSGSTGNSAYDIGKLFGSIFVIALLSIGIYYLLRTKDKAGPNEEKKGTLTKQKKDNKSENIDNSKFEEKVKTERVKRGYLKLTGTNPTPKELDELTLDEIAKCYKAGKI